MFRLMWNAEIIKVILGTPCRAYDDELVKSSTLARRLYARVIFTGMRPITHPRRQILTKYRDDCCPVGARGQDQRDREDNVPLAHRYLIERGLAEYMIESFFFLGTK